MTRLDDDAITERDPFDQHGFTVRLDWGPNGLRRLAPHADVVVVVDVLRFTSAVSVAVSRGAHVLPYRWRDDGEQAYALEHSAELAAPGGRYTLSPASLLEIERGTRLVLPSPNGSALSFGVRGHEPAAVVFAGCLRNAAAVAAAAAGHLQGGHVALIAAGERWRDTTGPLRPAVEDLLGAGAVAARLSFDLGATALSPEARAAADAFEGADADLTAALHGCASGRELAAKGFDTDVHLAAELDVDEAAPRLAGVAFVAE